MKPRARLIVFCAIVAAAAAALSAGVGAQKSVASLDAAAARIARIEGRLLAGIAVKGAPERAMALTDRMRVHRTPAVSVAVINGGEIEWARAYGVIEAGGSAAADPRTLFQAASISKPIAALAAMRLVDEGRLSLDEDVNRKLASWKVPANDLTAKEPVTLRRLLSHSAGLTVHGFPGYAEGDPVPTLAQVLDGGKPANTAPVRVDIPPGREWRYSGGGYTVLQQLLIDVTHRPFPDLVQGTVLQPLGMDDSTCEQPLPPRLRGRAATAHGGDGRPIAGRYHTYPEMAAAGLWTTPTDLARFAIEISRALAGRSRLLSAAAAREMLTVQKQGYGLGLSLTGTGKAARFGHGGANAGFRCQMVAYAETGQGAVVMTNADRGDRLAGEILRTIAAEYDWPQYPRQREKTVVTLPPADLEAFAGRYELRPGRVLTLSVADGKLVLDDRGQRIELLPEGAAAFFELEEETEIQFLKDPEGKVIGATVNGGAMNLRRLR